MTRWSARMDSRSVDIGGDANAAGCKQTKSSLRMRTKCTLQGLQDTATSWHDRLMLTTTKNKNEADGKAKPVNQPQSKARRDKSSTPSFVTVRDCCEAIVHATKAWDGRRYFAFRRPELPKTTCACWLHWMGYVRRQKKTMPCAIMDPGRHRVAT